MGHFTTNIILQENLLYSKQTAVQIYPSSIIYLNQEYLMTPKLMTSQVVQSACS